jgi:rubredoxin
VRIRRDFSERLKYSALFMCRDCGRKLAIPRLQGILPSLHRCCPRCQGTKLSRLKHRDPIDSLYRNPISRLQALLGAPLWHCSLCRLQFYDLRPGPRRET